MFRQRHRQTLAVTRQLASAAENTDATQEIAKKIEGRISSRAGFGHLLRPNLSRHARFPLQDNRGPLSAAKLAAKTAVFAQYKIETPVALRLNGDGLSIPTPLPERSMFDTRVTRKGRQVAWDFLADQELAVRAELVTDILSGIIDPDALQPAMGLHPQLPLLLEVPPLPSPQAKGGERESADGEHHQAVGPVPGLGLFVHYSLPVHS